MTKTDNEFDELVRAEWRKIKPLATDKVIALLEHNNAATRYASARELHLRGEQEAFERAAQLIDSGNVEDREIAAFLLGQLGINRRFPFKEASVPLLERLLVSESSPSVRATAIAALGFLQARSALDIITKMASDKSPTVRASVAFALGLLAVPQGTNILEILLNDADPEVSEFAKNALEIIADEESS